MRPLRVCLIASTRFPVREPFVGGLEALTHALARGLVERGHSVSLFAAKGSDPSLPVEHLAADELSVSAAARADVSAAPELWMADHHAYLGLMLNLARSGARRFDIIHNNSLHHLPVAMAEALTVPVVTTLHTPPTPWLESAVALAASSPVFTAVSQSTVESWRHIVPSTPILNGVDTERWPFGAGGGPAVWSGRLVPEKAPHEAIDAARAAGVPLVLAGPMLDARYFEEYVAPRLGPEAMYVGHLDHARLAKLLRSASVALVTPAWDEPYGLVAAEAMASGTPVAAYARGALPEIVSPETGVLAIPHDIPDLARALVAARECDRAEVRAHAVAHCSQQRMVEEYLQFYDQQLSGSVAA